MGRPDWRVGCRFAEALEDEPGHDGRQSDHSGHESASMAAMFGMRWGTAGPRLGTRVVVCNLETSRSRRVRANLPGMAERSGLVERLLASRADEKARFFVWVATLEPTPDPRGDFIRDTKRVLQMGGDPASLVQPHALPHLLGPLRELIMEWPDEATPPYLMKRIRVNQQALDANLKGASSEEEGRHVARARQLTALIKKDRRALSDLINRSE